MQVTAITPIDFSESRKYYKTNQLRFVNQKISIVILLDNELPRGRASRNSFD